MYARKKAFFSPEKNGEGEKVQLGCYKNHEFSNDCSLFFYRSPLLPPSISSSLSLTLSFFSIHKVQ